MKTTFTSLLVLLCLSFNVIWAQSDDDFFDPTILHEIHLNFSDTTFWDTLVKNYGDSSSFSGSDIEYLMADSIIIDGQKLDSVGVRLKGKSSYYYASDFKKPLKIDLNEFIDDQKYAGLKKFNLHNGSCDPSQLRDFLAYDILRKNGVKVPRVSHTKLYINGQYWGLFGIIEQIDKTFLKAHFSSSKGNLYKNNGWSNLQWLGTDVEPYKEDIELKTNEEDDDWSDFIEFVDVLNNTPDSLFEQEIQKVFNVDNFLRTLAVDIILDNWDSYVDNQRNWYIYHNKDTDLFEWIPWDYNLSMGGDFEFDAEPFRPFDADCQHLAEFQYYQQGNNIHLIDKSEPQAFEWNWTFSNGESSNLPNPIINVEQLTDAIEVCLMSKSINEGNICEHTRCRKMQLKTETACTTDSSKMAPYSINDPIFQIVIREDRYCCEEGWDAFCEAKYQQILTGQDAIGTLVNNFDARNLELFTRDTSKVLVVRLLNVPTFKERFLDFICVIMESNFTTQRLFPLIDAQTALIRPAIYEEPYAFFSKDFYEYDVGFGLGGGNDVNIPPLKTFINNRIAQIATQLNDIDEKCQTRGLSIGWQDITINEFVASNKEEEGGVPDPAGEYDDWIEIFNNTAEVIDLQGFFLSDKFDEPLQWAFPANTQIEPGDFLIIWADKDEDQEGLHASFKLDKDAEEILLAYEDGTIIDSISYGAQSTNIAMARVPNGTGVFHLQSPTFNKTNEVISSIPLTELEQQINIFPNPANAQITINLGRLNIEEDLQISIKDILGHTVYPQKRLNQKQLQLSTKSLLDGIYLVNIQAGNRIFTYKLFVQH